MGSGGVMPKFISDQEMEKLESKPKFISDQEMMDIDTQPKSQEHSLGTKSQAAIEGFGNAATFGYLPQLQAAVGGLIPDPNREVDEKLRSQGITIQQPDDTYVSRRDENIARQEGFAQDLPGYYHGGQAAGLLATAPIMGAGLTKAGLGASKAGLMGRVGQAAKSGGVVGAIQNPGDEKGNVDILQAGKRAEGAAKGAALGTAFQGSGEVVSKTASKISGIPKFIKDFAETRGAAATGMTKGQGKKLIQLDPTGLEGNSIKELGRFALDKKLVQAGDTIENIANKSGELKKQIGKEIGDSYEEVSKRLSDPLVFKSLPKDKQKILTDTNFNPQKMAKDFISDFKAKFKGTAGGDQAIKLVTKEAQNFAQKGNNPVGIMDMQKFKSELDDIIFAHDRTPGNLPANSKALKEFRDFLKSKIDDRVNAVDSVFGQATGSKLSKLNKEYSKAVQVNKIAKDRLSGELGNNMFSLTDKIGLLGGASVGGAEGYRQGGVEGLLKGAAAGAATGLVSKGSRTYGRPLLAKGAQGLSKVAGPLKHAGMAEAINKSPGLLGGTAARMEKKK